MNEFMFASVWPTPLLNAASESTSFAASGTRLSSCACRPAVMASRFFARVVVCVISAAIRSRCPARTDTARGVSFKNPSIWVCCAIIRSVACVAARIARLNSAV